jgi:hypothetical protein
VRGQAADQPEASRHRLSQEHRGTTAWSLGAPPHHTAASGHFMTHLSITEAVPAAGWPEADWGELVIGDEYNRR